jgi:hypothetical protein
MIYQAVVTDSRNSIGSLTKLDPSAVYSDMYLFSNVHQVGMNLCKETHKNEIKTYMLLLRTYILILHLTAYTFI